jgi:hypothetical protein
MSANDDSRDVLSEPTPSGWLAAPARETKRAAADTPRRPGRPLEMSETQVLARIREFATETRGLFRVHHAQPALYARARRLFGSWSAAVRAAGLDYEVALDTARARAAQARRQQRRRRSGPDSARAPEPDSGNL